jgi:hypothetical protein
MTIASPAGRESFRVESSRIRALSPSCLDKLRALTETREGCDRRGIAALCVSPLRRFRAEGVDPVDCQSTQRNYVRALRRHLFLGARTRPTMTVAKLECLA